MSTPEIIAAIALGILTNLVTGLFLQPLAGRGVHKAGNAILSVSSQIERYVYRRISRRDVSLITALQYAVALIISVILSLSLLVTGGLVGRGTTLADILVRGFVVITFVRLVIEVTILRYTNNAILYFEQLKALAGPKADAQFVNDVDAQFARARSRRDYRDAVSTVYQRVDKLQITFDLIPEWLRPSQVYRRRHMGDQDQ